MNRRIILLLGFCLLLLTSASARKMQLVACGDTTVYILDYKLSQGKNFVTNWKITQSEILKQVPKQFRRYICFDDCKPIAKGKQLLLTSSAGSTFIVDIKSKKCLFWANTPMAHSAEVLPRGRIVVANSTDPKGNSLEVYDTARPGVVVFRDSLYFGHGAVWMKNKKRLYALGFQELREYSLKNWNTDKPELVREATYEIPTKEGHDLIKVDNNTLMFTTVSDVYKFDVNTHQIFRFSRLAGMRNVKSVNYDIGTKNIVYTKAETSWWTENIYSKNPDKVITIPGFELYKVRVLK